MAVLLAGACIIGLAPILVRLADSGPAAVGFWRMLFALPLLAFIARRESGGVGPAACGPPAVGASTILPTPMITLGSALAKCRATSRNTWAAKSPRLVNSIALAPPSAQAWMTLMQVSTSGW